jgi:hypothetical protein
MAGGGPGPATPINLFEARLKTDLAGVSNTLTLLPYNGNAILVNGQRVIVPGGGMTRAVGDNLITVAGADFGAAGSVSTLYYVYVSNARATFSPLSIRLSATPPSLVNGVKYLNTSGNALNWRFVGWVRLNATPQFESSLTKRFIANQYNRIATELFTCPGYADVDAFTSYSTSSATWVEANGGTGSKIEFISNGEDAVEYIALGSGINDTFGQRVFLGVGEDSATSPVTACFNVAVVANLPEALHAGKNTTFSEGYHFLDLLITISVSIGTATYYASQPRSGAAADPATTHLQAYVMV